MKCAVFFRLLNSPSGETFKPLSAVVYPERSQLSVRESQQIFMGDMKIESLSSRFCGCWSGDA